jgi:nucleoside-diphosphate-sugar epimerase
MKSVILSGCVALSMGVDASPTVLVTGATGGTGIQVFKQLKADGGFNVRAFVRSADKAKKVLGCDKCDESEGIFVGDLSDVAAVNKVMQGVDKIAITSSAVFDCNGPLDPTKPPCYYHNGSAPIDVDWHGTKTQVEALASQGHTEDKQIAYVSTRDTTDPNSRYGNLGDGHTSFYHLNAEAFIMSSGVPFTILKACGLGDDKPGQYKLVVGHDGKGYDVVKDSVIDRSDVARVIVNAFHNPASSKNLRFDLCTDEGPPATKDADIVKDVFDAARYPWQKRVIMV